jgi:tetratricopeptide (TPR) repeat protein
MSVSYTHGREFVAQVRPFLEARDVEGLLRHLHAYWPGDRLRGLLHCHHDEAAKVALACLSLVGSNADLGTVAPLLGSDDCTTVGLAEYTMWALWFRAGDTWANRRMMHAVRLISENKLDRAIGCLTRILSHRPGFAEAYNQRAIAHFLKEDYSASIADCLQALKLNPYHFGAAAGLGHCYAAQGQLELAVERYQSALQIHPRLEGIRQSITEIREVLGQTAAKPSKPAKSREP